jgi:hypothetical protein
LSTKVGDSHSVDCTIGIINNINKTIDIPEISDTTPKIPSVSPLKYVVLAKGKSAADVEPANPTV